MSKTNESTSDFYDKILKKILDDPKVDKKTLVSKLLNQIQSHDVSADTTSNTNFGGASSS